MAYSPVGHGRGLLNNPTLKKIAKRHDATCRDETLRESWMPAQIALAWVLRQSNMIAIPKASNQTHVRGNAQSAEIELSRRSRRARSHLFAPEIQTAITDALKKAARRSALSEAL